MEACRLLQCSAVIDVLMGLEIAGKPGWSQGMDLAKVRASRVTRGDGALDTVEWDELRREK